MPWLKKGRMIDSPVTHARYKVVSDRVAQGGFGEIYRAKELDHHDDESREVAIKVGVDAMFWHGEAYFGRLLSDQGSVVSPIEAFPIFERNGRARQVKYVLIFPWMKDGTVHDFLTRTQASWPERTVKTQMSCLLRVLSLLHQKGICHGDITPRNVFVDGRRLLLGDLGIAKQTLTGKRVRLDARTPLVFLPRDAHNLYWTPADDVYQLGLTALSLLSGEVITTNHVCGRAFKALEISDHFKGWIRDSLVRRNSRFTDADAALQALNARSVRSARSPKTLRGQHIVFTGTLPINRDKAKAQAKRAGAIIQEKVNSRTSLIVVGQKNALMIGKERGTKLFDAHRRLREGQRIAVINASRFQQLLTGNRQ
jgi:serine/threonine protein kinase